MRIGSCNACGACCKDISLKHGPNVIKNPEEFEKLQRKYHMYRNFKIMKEDEDSLVFICHFLDEETGKCTSYHNRPPVCRNYPHEVIFKLGAVLSDKCGYQFVPLRKFKDILAEVEKKYDNGSN